MSTRPYFKFRGPLRSGPYDPPPSTIKISEDGWSSDDTYYHYTSIDSFVKIISSGMFFASNALNMNDSEELSFAAHVISGSILHNVEDSERRNSILRFLNFVIPDNLPDKIFLISLSKNASQLSQWRSYASPEGVSFGWKKEELSSFAAATDAQFFEVIYDWERQESLVSGFIQTLMESFDQNWIEDPILAVDKYKTILKPEFDRVAPMMKHAGFGEESEARIVWNNNSNSFPVRFSARNVDIKPYIEIDISKSRLKQINAVNLGPTSDIFRRFYEIEKLIDSSQFGWNAIIGSGIPYQRL